MQLLFRISYRVVADEEAAEDLAHDSLIKANEKELVFPSLNDAKYTSSGKAANGKRIKKRCTKIIGRRRRAKPMCSKRKPQKKRAKRSHSFRKNFAKF